MPSSRGSSRPRDQTCISYVSCVGRWVLYHWYHLGSCSWSLFLFPWWEMDDFDFGIHNKYSSHLVSHGLPRWLSGEEPTCQCRRRRRRRFDPLIGKISWRKEWLPIPVFLRGECHGQRSLASYLQSMRSQRVGCH